MTMLIFPQICSLERFVEFELSAKDKIIVSLDILFCMCMDQLTFTPAEELLSFLQMVAGRFDI